MTVIFDLDHTLLDTEAFKASLSAALSALGPSPERVTETYVETVGREDGAYDYDPDVHIGLLAADIPGSVGLKEAHRAVEGTVRRIGEHLFPGVAELLDALRDRGVRLVLLTMGNEAWQRRKIAASGLRRFFDAVRTVSADKHAVIEEYADGGTTVVVNDNGAEIDAMAAVAPEFRYVVKRGPKPLPASTDAVICDTMVEVGDAVLAALGMGK